MDVAIKYSKYCNKCLRHSNKLKWYCLFQSMEFIEKKDTKFRSFQKNSEQIHFLWKKVLFTNLFIIYLLLAIFIHMFLNLLVFAVPFKDLCHSTTCFFIHHFLQLWWIATSKQTYENCHCRKTLVTLIPFGDSFFFYHAISPQLYNLCRDFLSSRI